MKTLILTPNKNEMCGMYQLAKDMQNECPCNYKCECHISHNFEQDIIKCKYCSKTDIITKDNIKEIDYLIYDKFITFLYPMHKYGWSAKNYFKKIWVCYDQKVPPPTKLYFPNFFRRIYMKWFCFVNERSKKGADEYWDVTERKQKPRWIKKYKSTFKQFELKDNYSLYLGRRTDYKNYKWLSQMMKDLNIDLISSKNWTDDQIHNALSHTKLLVTASLWEGYGRSVMEAEALGIPAVAYDVGTHKKHIKKGICVPVGNKILFKKAIKEIWNK